MSKLGEYLRIKPTILIIWNYYSDQWPFMINIFMKNIYEIHMYVFQECRVFKWNYHNSSSPYFSALYFFLLTALMIMFGWWVIWPMTEVNIMQAQQRLCSSLQVKPFPFPALSLPCSFLHSCDSYKIFCVLQRFAVFAGTSQGYLGSVVLSSPRLRSVAQWKWIWCLMLPCLTWGQHHSD